MDKFACIMIRVKTKSYFLQCLRPWLHLLLLMQIN